MPDAFQVRCRLDWKRQRRLVLLGFAFRAELLASTRDGKALFIQQLLDAKHSLDIFATVHSLTSAAFHRLELRELGFPETQNVRRKAAEFRDFTNPEVELVGNDNFRRSMCFTALLGSIH